MKYIIVSDGFTEHAIVFSEGLTHRDVYEYTNQIKSAGFCRLGLSLNNDIVYQCYGKSDSLGLVSRKEEDSKILNQQLSRGEF